MTTTPDPKATALGTEIAFSGAKAAFFHGSQILTYLRDDFPGLPWPGYWDLPGGGREGQESPEACLLRELEEEFGLRLPAARLEHRLFYPMPGDITRQTVFFAGRLTAPDIAAIRFGDEGQRWQMMEASSYLAHPKAVPVFQDRLRQIAPAYLAL